MFNNKKHGIDSDKRRHFQRFSGMEFMTAPEEKVPRPPTRMEPISANSTVEFQATRNKLYQKVTVDSLLTVEAHGADLQYIALRLPTQGSQRGTWVMEEFTLEDVFKDFPDEKINEMFKEDNVKLFPYYQCTFSKFETN